MIQWRKSNHSQSQAQGECVEVSTNTGEATLIRDSRDPSGPNLLLSRGGFTDLINKIKAGDTP